jgi:hypothetical protein
VFKGTYPETTAALYEELLPRLPDIADHPDRFRALWEEEDAQLARSEQAIREGAVRIEEHPALDLAVVTSAAGPFPHAMAIHNATRMFRLLLIAGATAEFRYRYESWVQYVSARPLPRVDLTPLAEQLSAEDGGPWVFDGVDEITPRLAREDGGQSRLSPADLRKRIVSFL